MVRHGVLITEHLVAIFYRNDLTVHIQKKRHFNENAENFENFGKILQMKNVHFFYINTKEENLPPPSDFDRFSIHDDWKIARKRFDPVPTVGLC